MIKSKCESLIRFFYLCKKNKKTDLKNATGVATSNFAKETGFAILKSDVEKLDTDKLKNVPSGLSSLKRKVDKLHIGKLETTAVDLSKVSNVVKNIKMLRRQNVMTYLKISSTDTSNLVKKS